MEKVSMSQCACGRETTTAANPIENLVMTGERNGIPFNIGMINPFCCPECAGAWVAKELKALAEPEKERGIRIPVRNMDEPPRILH